MGEQKTLWCGLLDPWMDERFVSGNFNAAGHQPIVIKRIMHRQTGQPAGYCFVEFADKAAAESALLLHNKPMPLVADKVFRLNWSSHSTVTPNEAPAGVVMNGPGAGFSVFVGDLSADVSESSLLAFFQARFLSCQNAKIVIDSMGRNKGYGFVKFGDESEQQRALKEMVGVIGCGTKALRIGLATPRAKQPSPVAQTTSPGYAYYQQQPYNDFGASAEFYDPNFSYAQQQYFPYGLGTDYRRYEQQPHQKVRSAGGYQSH